MKQNTAVICLSPINGGMELASIKISKLLTESVKTFLIAKQNSFIASLEDSLKEENVTLKTIDFSMNLSFNLIFGVRKILIENNIKNIIFLGASEMKSLYFATLGLNINFIVRQGTTKSTPKTDFVHKLLYSNVSYFIGNSEFIKENIIKILPIPSSAQVKTIYASVELEENTHQNKNDKLNLLHIGRVTRGKGQIEAIQACKALHSNNIPFVLRFLGDIHDKNYYNEITELLEDLPYKNSIVFEGFVSPKKYLQTSNIFLFPTYGEGMSNAIIEALSNSLITIVYNNTSTPEFKKLGFHIHLTNHNNVNELQSILLDVTKEYEKEKTLSQQNHSLALQTFSKEKERDNYLSILK